MFIQKIFGVINKKRLQDLNNKIRSNISCMVKPDTFETTSNNESVKNIIKTVTGENTSVSRDFNISTLQGLCNTFKFHPEVKLFNVYDKVNSTKWTTVITDYVECIYNKNHNLKKFLVHNAKYKDIGIYDKNGNMIKYYTPGETNALLKYKHNSKKIHKSLRYNKDPGRDIKEQIENLSQIFKYNYKVYTAPKDMIVYRALDNDSLQKIMSLPENGIFKSPSFVSVSTKKESIKQFLNLKNYNHIIKIKIPKGTKYVNMDEIGHIMYIQKPENELLLNKGSEFLIKNKNGMIEAEYIR